MRARQTKVTAAILVLSLGAGVGVWRGMGPLPGSAPEAPAAALPIPPFPPRIASGAPYEQCLAALSEDPEHARTMADTWQTEGGGDGAVHCQGLALIATGEPEAGAARLEALARGSLAPPLARAAVLGQAAQARLMAAQPDRSVEDATQALKLAPENTDLLMTRAMAAAELDRLDAAIADLNRVIALEPDRADALVMRAGTLRQQDRLNPAMEDVQRALALDPDEAEALLERGIIRQRLGDIVGARADWQRARAADPNSTTADLAEQNLALLDAGPRQR